MGPRSEGGPGGIGRLRGRRGGLAPSKRVQHPVCSIPGASPTRCTSGGRRGDQEDFSSSFYGECIVIMERVATTGAWDSRALSPPTPATSSSAPGTGPCAILMDSVVAAGGRTSSLPDVDEDGAESTTPGVKREGERPNPGLAYGTVSAGHRTRLPRRAICPASYSARRGRAELGPDRLELAQGARLELADALAGDAELGRDLLERVRTLAVEAEAKADHLAQALVQALERPSDRSTRRRSASATSGCSAFTSSSMSP